MKIYEEKIAESELRLKAVKARDRQLSIARLILILGSLYLFYLGLAQQQWHFLGYGAVALLAFVLLLFWHQQVRDKAKRLKECIKINREEIGFLKGDLSPFDEGSQFLDREHLYSFDLDIFGPHSLFHHLNRSATLKGKQRLADAFRLSPDPENIKTRQAGVKELTPDIGFRQQFMLEARLLEEDPDLEHKLENWQKEKLKSGFLLKPVLLYIFSAIAIGGLVYFAINPTALNFYLFAALAAVNIGLVFSQMKKIRKEQLKLDGLANSLLIYSKLLKLIEERSSEDEMLRKTAERLRTGEKSASQALYRFSRICDAFDQLHNPVGSLIMNALFLYHLHTLRHLVHWKRQYSGSINQWLEIVAQWDALCSLANFAYNNSSYVYPQLSAEPVYRAENLGHPLISSRKRVKNSIGFDTQRYVILTGSNMSGKSTFLKTLGVNLVLAGAGAPVCADEMKFFPFRLLSSMKMVDSIEKEQSYFQAEVLRLKKLMEILKTGEPAFVLLDEILRGTNSDDKRNGTRLFLEKIAGCNAYGVIATHDIDIADLAGKNPQVFRDMYFESRFEDGELTFDYRLREGICTTPNATELMRSHGII